MHFFQQNQRIRCYKKVVQTLIFTNEFFVCTKFKRNNATLYKIKFVFTYHYDDYWKSGKNKVVDRTVFGHKCIFKGLLHT